MWKLPQIIKMVFNVTWKDNFVWWSLDILLYYDILCYGDKITSTQ